MDNLTHKSTIEFRAGGGTGRKCLECCVTEEWKSRSRESTQDDSKTSNGVRSGDIGGEEGT